MVLGLQPAFHGWLSIEHDPRFERQIFRTFCAGTRNHRDYVDSGVQDSLAFLAMACRARAGLFYRAQFFRERHDFKTYCAAAGCLFGTAYWWNSLPREMFFYGMIGFPAAAISRLGSVLVYRLAMESAETRSYGACWLANFRGSDLSFIPCPVAGYFSALMSALLIVQPRTDPTALLFFWLVARWRHCRPW